MRRVSIAFALCSAIALPACGSASSDKHEPGGETPATNSTMATVAQPSPPPAPIIPEPPSRAELMRIGNHVCAAAVHGLASLNVSVGITGADPDALADLIDDYAGRLERAAATLRTITPPPGDELFAQRLDTQQAKITTTLRSIAAAYRARDDAAASIEVAKLNRQGTELQQLAADYGLLKCTAAP